MDRIKRISTTIGAASVGTAVVSAQQGAKWLLDHQNKLPDWGAPVASLVIFVVIWHALRVVLELTLERTLWIRRLLLGDQFVEGVWFDLIFEGHHMISVGHSMIKYSDGRFRLGGEDFPVDGSGKGHFHIKLVEFNWPNLEYTYEYRTRDSDAKGYGIAQFIERFGPPTKFTGCFVNRADGKRFTFESFRVTSKPVLRDFENEKLKEETIRKHLANEIADHRQRRSHF